MPLVDLGSAPRSNSYLTADTVHTAERWFPLRVFVCERCWLAQTDDASSAAEIFSDDYAYFSSYSRSWLAHAEKYVNDMVDRFALTRNARVVEVAANDGYLLQYVLARGMTCLGIEPTASTAAAARLKGIPIVQEFFGSRVARELASAGQADLMTANNVLAHVPDIDDFVSGFAALLAPSGVATFEFPHLLQLVDGNQFDTIYHEHFSYLSLTAVHRIFSENGLQVFDIEEHPTHGGSLRVFAQRRDCGQRRIEATVDRLLQRESLAGLATPQYYAAFQQRADRIKNDFLAALIEAKRRGASVAGYGAAAKGNTLMNYAGVRPDLISFIVDQNPAKQGKFMPGSRIPIVDEAVLREQRPALVVILPWNLRTELTRQLEYIREWGGKFLTAVPQLEIFP